MIGSDITITGRVETKFGQVGIVPAGVGNTGSPAAQEVDLTSVATINSTATSRCPTPVVLDRTKSEAQGLDRAYYRSLQGMRVQLPEGIATGGGTTKFRDVFVEPGTTAQRLFRKNDHGGEQHAVVTTSRPSSASRPTAAPATRPTRGCRGRARRRSTSTSSTSPATSSAR